MTSADKEVNSKYGSMRARHGTNHASANGYIGQWFFQREQKFLTPRIQPGLVLDVACGSALMLQNCQDLEVIGIDYNQTACEQARLNQQLISRGDAFNLPFAAETFDSVVNCQFLNQQPRELRAKFLTEIARVLKPEGECHIMWRGAETLIHQSVNFAENLIRKIQSEPIFPQYHHPPDILLAEAERNGLYPLEVNMTLPIGPATVTPGSALAKFFGASHYVRFRRAT